MSECKKIQDYLSLYFDGLLGSEEYTKVQEHIKVCPNCSKILNDYSALKNAFRDVEEIEPGNFAFNKIKARIKEEQARSKRLYYIGYSIGTLGLATATVLLVILLRYSPTHVDKFEIAKNLEVLQDMELIQNLDFYEYLADELAEDI